MPNHLLHQHGTFCRTLIYPYSIIEREQFKRSNMTHLLEFHFALYCLSQKHREKINWENAILAKIISGGEIKNKKKESGHDFLFYLKKKRTFLVMAYTHVSMFCVLILFYKHHHHFIYNKSLLYFNSFILRSTSEWISFSLPLFHISSFAHV